jgi:hypothetical protein
MGIGRLTAHHPVDGSSRGHNVVQEARASRGIELDSLRLGLLSEVRVAYGVPIDVANLIGRAVYA